MFLPKALCCEAENLGQHSRAFLVGRASGLEDQGRKVVRRSFEVLVVLCVLLVQGVVLARLFQADVSVSERARDGDVDGKTFSTRPVGEGDVTWAPAGGGA